MSEKIEENQIVENIENTKAEATENDNLENNNNENDNKINLEKEGEPEKTTTDMVQLIYYDLSYK